MLFKKATCAHAHTHVHAKLFNNEWIDTICKKIKLCHFPLLPRLFLISPHFME